MIPVVDILVANWNTLPWLKLQVHEIRKFAPHIPHRLFVWDNGSSDGSAEWIPTSGLEYHLSPTRRTHAESLAGLLSKSTAPYIAFMDVDAIPVKERWLEEAVDIVKDERIGAVGLRGGRNDGRHRIFVHPSFCVVRRELYDRLGVGLDIVETGKVENNLDTGEALCQKFENEGYKLEFIGDSGMDITAIERLPNKVVHFWSSTPVLAEGRTDLDWLSMVKQVVKGHRHALDFLALWKTFEGYVLESVNQNPLCQRYLL